MTTALSAPPSNSNNVKAGQNRLNEAQLEALKSLAGWLGFGAFLGGTYRAGTGLYDLLSRRMSNVAPAEKPIVIDVPYRRHAAETEEERKKQLPIAKAAAEEGLIRKVISDLLESFPMGGKARTVGEVPMFWPAVTVGPPLAALGAYKLTDRLLHKQHKRELEEEISDAREDYRRAMLRQFQPRQIKASDYRTALTSSSALDDLSNQFAKEAQLGLVPHRLKSQAMGFYLTLASLLALGSGSLMYRYARQMSPERAKAEAIKKQIRESSLVPPTFARLVPVDDEEEQDKSRKRTITRPLSPELQAKS